MFKNIPLIFTHIPKTAGISISSWAEREELVRFSRPAGEKHTTTKEDIEEWKKFVETPNKIQSFTVVRNPFDRLVSCWKYYVQRGKCNFETLEEFVFAERYMNPTSSNPKKKLVVENIGHVNSISYNSMNSFINQDTIILRYENLVEDFKIIQNMFDRHTPLNWLNGSNREEGYRQYYNEKTKEYISQLYADDLRIFNYKF